MKLRARNCSRCLPAGDCSERGHQRATRGVAQRQNSRPVYSAVMSEFDAKALDWDSDPRRVDRARKVAEAIVRLVPVTPEMTVFEYGCGTGLLSFALQPHVAHLTLADSSREMLGVLERKIAACGARNMTPIELDLSKDPIPAGRYDLVCTLMTLHHVPDTDGLLRAFRTLLKAPGFLCVADLDAEDGSFHGPDADVHKGFDRAELAVQMERAGLSHERFTTVFEMESATAAGKQTFRVFLAIAERSSPLS
jgi:ubiquinone/menaquinone biosynthesis C-methylase UbiE